MTRTNGICGEVCDKAVCNCTDECRRESEARAALERAKENQK